MGCVPSVEDQTAQAPEVFPGRISTDTTFYVVFILANLLTFSLVGGCGVYADLDDLLHLDYFWTNDILEVIPQALKYYDTMIVNFGYACGISLILVAMMQYIADVLIVVTIGAISIFMAVSVGLLWNLFAVESSTEMLFGAILMTLFMIGWFIFLVDIGNKLSLIFKLYEIAGLITFNNPVILMVALVAFVINIGIICLGAFGFAVVSAAWLKTRDRDDWEDFMVLVIISYMAVIFMTMWWLNFIQCAMKFIVGYSVGAWYFDDDDLNEEGSTFHAIFDMWDFHMGTVCLSSLMYTVLFIPREIYSFVRNLRGTKFGIWYVSLFPEILVNWFVAVWEMLTGNALYICALHSLPFCMASNRSTVLTTFADNLKVTMVGNVLCGMSILLVALASTIITVVTADKEDQDHLVFLGVFLYFSAVLVSTFIMTVFLCVTKSLYVCIYIDLMTNGIDLPFTVLQNINLYVKEVQAYAQKMMGISLPEAPPDAEEATEEELAEMALAELEESMEM